MRILALDVGDKRIGVAVSDRLGWTAQPVGTIHRRGDEAAFQEIQKVFREQEGEEILVGLPLMLDGSEGRQAEKVRQFAEGLRKFLGEVPLSFWDERLSTVEAEWTLRESDLSPAKKKKVIDTMAAIVILQGYLDSQGGGKKS